MFRLVITPPWGLSGEAYHKPRATHEANDFRTFGARKLKNYSLIFSFCVPYRGK